MLDIGYHKTSLKKTPTIKIIITIPLTSFLIYQIKTTLILSITQKKTEKNESPKKFLILLSEKNNNPPDEQ